MALPPFTGLVTTQRIWARSGAFIHAATTVSPLHNAFPLPCVTAVARTHSYGGLKQVLARVLALSHKIRKTLLILAASSVHTTPLYSPGKTRLYICAKMQAHNIMEENGTDRCFRFRDGTPPVCGAEGQLGRLCRPCHQEGRLGKAIFNNQTARARRLLLRGENQNLRTVNTLTTLEQRAVISETEAWRAAVAAKTSERDLLLERRRLDEEHQE